MQPIASALFCTDEQGHTSRRTRTIPDICITRSPAVISQTQTTISNLGVCSIVMLPCVRGIAQYFDVFEYSMQVSLPFRSPPTRIVPVRPLVASLQIYDTYMHVAREHV